MHVTRSSSTPPATPIYLVCVRHVLSSMLRFCLDTGENDDDDDTVPQNIFARIIRKEEPADIVWEDDTVVAFKDAHPASTVHLLIVPKHAAVRNPNHLTVQHVDLLEHMVSEATYPCCTYLSVYCTVLCFIVVTS